MIRFLRWLEQEVPGGDVDEASAAAHLDKLRMEQEERSEERYDVDYEEEKPQSFDDDDFDFDKYMSDIDRMLDEDPRYNP